MDFEQQLIDVLRQIVDKLGLIEGDLAVMMEEGWRECGQDEPAKRPKGRN